VGFRPFFSPKGWDNLAQGNALGTRAYWPSSLKGWDIFAGRIAALQAAGMNPRLTQGVALG
jgi:hypothetical protein